jgi:hypothetical protein
MSLLESVCLLPTPPPTQGPRCVLPPPGRNPAMHLREPGPGERRLPTICWLAHMSPRSDGSTSPWPAIMSGPERIPLRRFGPHDVLGKERTEHSTVQLSVAKARELRDALDRCIDQASTIEAPTRLRSGAKRPSAELLCVIRSAAGEVVLRRRRFCGLWKMKAARCPTGLQPHGQGRPRHDGHPDRYRHRPLERGSSARLPNRPAARPRPGAQDAMGTTSPRAADGRGGGPIRPLCHRCIGSGNT